MLLCLWQKIWLDINYENFLSREHLEDTQGIDKNFWGKILLLTLITKIVMKAYAKNIRISPKKLRVVGEVVRGMDAPEALKFLKFAPKKWADMLYKVLASAVANAVHNDSQEAGSLVIQTLVITKWMVYKRGRPVSRGRMHPILKRTSNVHLELQVK